MKVLLTTPAMQQTIQELRSQEYLAKLLKKNISKEDVEEIRGEVNSSEKAMYRKTVQLWMEAKKSLRFFYGDEGDILIPFSGGRDSTLLSLATLVAVKERRVTLVTVLTGLAKPGTAENAAAQAAMIIEMAGESNTNSVSHQYVDLSNMFSKHVIKSAYSDVEKLGFPGVCTKCKMIMEITLAQIAVDLGYAHVPFGYAQYQALQGWSEQTVAFRDALDIYHRHHYPQLNVGSPLKFVLMSPIDAPLLLSWLGVEWENHKKEGKCCAGGMNPLYVDELKLFQFLRNELKNFRLPGTFALQNMAISNTALQEQAESLKNDPGFMAGAFNEGE